MSGPKAGISMNRPPRLRARRAQISFALVAITLIAVLESPAHAQDCIRYEDFMHVTGAVDTPGTATGVSIANGLALIADREDGLVIIDVSDLVAPIEIGSLDTPGTALGVAVNGDYAYVADGAMGLLVINVSDPANPVLVGACDTMGLSRAVAVDSAYAYVAEGGWGMRVIDVSDPSHPVLVATADTPGSATDIAVRLPYAYVADDVAGLSIVRISTPTAPILVATVDTPGLAHAVAIGGSRAYIADYWNGVQIVNVAAPAQAWLEGSVYLRDVCQDVGFSNGIVYAALKEAPASLVSIDPSAPGAPIVLGSVQTRGGVGLAVDAGIACVTEGAAGVSVVDVANPHSPPLLASVPTTEQAEDAIVVGQYAYLGTRRLLAVDISEPAAPSVVGSADTWDYVVSISVSGDIACTGGSQGLEFFRVGQAADPERLGGVETDWANNAVMSGSFAYAATIHGLAVIDASDPAHPAIVSTIPTTASVYGITTSGEYLYMTTWDTLHVIDVSTPAAPVEVAQLNGAGGREVVVRDGIACMAGEGGIVCADVTDPSAPRLLGGIPLPGGSTDIALTGSCAYVANDYSLHVVDIDDPVAPRCIGGMSFADYVWGVGAGEGLVLVANGTLGMKIFEAECDAAMDAAESQVGPAAARALALPNPCNAGMSVIFDLANEGTVRMVIHDIAGRTVRDLGDRRMSAGRRQVSWDGLDNAGRRVRPGVYMIRITTPDARQTARVVMQR